MLKPDTGIICSAVWVVGSFAAHTLGVQIGCIALAVFWLVVSFSMKRN